MIYIELVRWQAGVRRRAKGILCENLRCVPRHGVGEDALGRILTRREGSGGPNSMGKNARWPCGGFIAYPVHDDKGCFLYLRRWDGSARRRRGLARESVPLAVRIKTPSACSYMPSSRGHQPFTSERTPLPRMTRGGRRGDGHMTVCFTCNEAFAEESAIHKPGRGVGKRRRERGGVAPFQCGRVAGQQVRISGGAEAGVSISGAARWPGMVYAGAFGGLVESSSWRYYSSYLRAGGE